MTQHDDRSFASSFEKAFDAVKADYPFLTAGFIFFGLKSISDQENEAIFRRICNLNWKFTIGIDMVQEEDKFGSIEKIDKIIDDVLADYPEQSIRKCYHAGETRDHTNRNIEIAIKGGSARIGHGLNITQHIEILPICTGVCFELCPVSNIVSGSSARNDLRLSTAPILLGLGVPVSISPDDPGKFGYEDSTVDYFCSGVSFNWSLKHFKLVGTHSINHSICSEGVKIRAYKVFEEGWQQWVDQFLSE